MIAKHMPSGNLFGKRKYCWYFLYVIGMLHIFSLAVHAQIISESPKTVRDSMAMDPQYFLEMASKSMKWNEPAEPGKIIGPIYFVGTKGLGSYLITTDDGHFLLFSGMPPSGPMIEASIRKLGFKPTDIKYILTNHAHVDHVGGHAYLKKVSGAKLAIMDREKELIESGGKTDFHYKAYPSFHFEPVRIDQVLKDGDQLTLGSITLTARLTPGHTKGTTTWIMNLVVNGKTYLVVFPDGTSVNPGYQLGKNPSYAGIAENYRKTFSILENLKPDIWLPAHTNFFDLEGKRARAGMEGIRAWVDPEGYKKFIATAKKSYEAEIKK